jgi:hypothetical protein
MSMDTHDEERHRSAYDHWPFEEETVRRLLTRMARAMEVPVPRGGFPEEWFVTVLERLNAHDHRAEPPKPALHVVR